LNDLPTFLLMRTFPSINKWVIITFDKDFGELIYKEKSNMPAGIILLRVKTKIACIYIAAFEMAFITGKPFI